MKTTNRLDFCNSLKLVQLLIFQNVFFFKTGKSIGVLEKRVE